MRAKSRAPRFVTDIAVAPSPPQRVVPGRGHLLADEVVAHGPGGRELDERGIPALDLRLLEELLQEAWGEFHIESERRLRQRVGELRGVVAARGGDGGRAALGRDPEEA